MFAGVLVIFCLSSGKNVSWCLCAVFVYARGSVMLCVRFLLLEWFGCLQFAILYTSCSFLDPNRPRLK